MKPALRESLWSLDEIGFALVRLVAASGVGLGSQTASLVPAHVVNDRPALARWVEAFAESLRVECESFRPLYGDLEVDLPVAAPLLLRVPDGDVVRVVAVLAVRGAAVQLLGKDDKVRAIHVEELSNAVRANFDPEADARVDALLSKAEVRPERRLRARVAILAEHVGRDPLDAGFSIAPSAALPLLTQARRAGLVSRAFGILVLHLVLQLLSLGAWWIIGTSALDGRMEVGWFFAWALLLASCIPVRAVASWWQSVVTLGFATFLKRRLLRGALRLEPEEVRTSGAGNFLGRVIESEAVESLATSGALLGALSILELLVAGVLLVEVASSVTVVCLVAWMAMTMAVAWRYATRLGHWTSSRLETTNGLVERMVGHRTRLAQEPPGSWHLAEDESLAEYAERSAVADRPLALLAGFMPRAWLAVGLLSLAPAIARGNGSTARASVAVGGIILAYRALARLVAALNSLLGARVAWSEAKELFDAGGRENPVGSSPLLGPRQKKDARVPVLRAHDLSFAFPNRPSPVLKNANVRLMAGERVLLEGASGAGKSTLGAILSGNRAPSSGLLFLNGLDRQTLGLRSWRQRVVAAPQFHENHVFTGSFAYNLLMGRGWPPRAGDLEAATETCNELGLGPLLKRMPSGILQMVGETGWQLSHGERSRLFIARALLQNAELVILDESFAALDPETLAQSLRCVIARAPTLVVIAHP